jgi:hypothetical protein
MAKSFNVEILASKRLTKSFRQVDDSNIWQSISLSLEEAKEVILRALDRVNSEPLTITVSIIEKGNKK